jgi:hypothetical protein
LINISGSPNLKGASIAKANTNINPITLYESLTQYIGKNMIFSKGE